MEASKRGKTKKNCPRKLIRPPPAGVLVDSGAFVLGAPALLLPGCQPRRHPLPAPPSTSCAYRHGESLTPSSLKSFSTTLSSCPSPSSPTSPWWSANHHHHNQPCCRHHSSSSSPLCVIHILAWWLVTSEFERTVNFRKINFLTSLPHLQCQFNLHARRTNENTFEI